MFARLIELQPDGMRCDAAEAGRDLKREAMRIRWSADAAKQGVFGNGRHLSCVEMAYVEERSLSVRGSIDAATHCA